MEALFLSLVKLSLWGSLLVLAVLPLRLIFRKAPKWVFCLLWGIVALRLLLPFSVETVFSVVPESIATGQAVTDVADGYLGEVDVIFEGAREYDAALEAGRQPVSSPQGSYVVTEKGTLEEPATVEAALVPVLSWVWLLGMVAMLGYTAVSYLLLKRRVATATAFRKGIRRSEWVESPFVLGFFRPVIYLPYDLDPVDLENVVAHEQAHICRKDHWWKPLGFLILSVYWFNPVMWLAYILLCRDIEAACDEKVIRNMDKEAMRAYSTALLNCSVHRRQIAACPLAFGEVGVKARIKSVMHYKKPAFWVVILALLASVIAAVTLLTDPVSQDTRLMGAYYTVEELLYTDKQETVDLYSRFCVTADYCLYAQKQDSDSWLRGEQMEFLPLTAKELESYAAHREGWHRRYSVGKIADAYILRAENGYFYLVIQTEKGDTLLGFGRETGDEGMRLRYLYTLKSEMEPHEADMDFLALSLAEPVGVVECIEVFTTEKHPGFAVVGFLSGYDETADHGYNDMGYAVFQTNDTGWRLLDYHVYSDAANSGEGIYICDDPAVFSPDGEITNETAFDVILSCNENLGKILREYYRNETMVHQIASMQTGSRSMHLFPWDVGVETDQVKQFVLDKNGDSLVVKTMVEKILDLVDEIINNPDIAHSSNPYDYIAAKQDVYDKLLAYGDKAVSCLVGYLRGSDTNGLREYIMAAACAELTGIGQDKTVAGWATARQWLALYDLGEDVLGTWEDQIGASIDVGSLFGIDCVWSELVETRPIQGGLRTVSTSRFYYMGDGTAYFYYGSPVQETDLVTVKGYIWMKTGDFDGDGIVELLVWGNDQATPFRLYDLVGTEIVEERLSRIPEEAIDYEVLFDWEGAYFYEEKWAWFLKDPQTYIRELGKRPESSYLLGCPTGIIPQGTDTALIEDAYLQIHSFLDGEPTALEKKIAYEILAEMKFSFMPTQNPGEGVNYPRLFEKWGAQSEGSSEEMKCYHQMITLFGLDPVGFVKGLAMTDETALTKNLNLVIARLAKENFLYNADAFAAVLNRLDRELTDEGEKAVLRQLRMDFEAWQAPSLVPLDMVSGTSEDLWDAFFYAPEEVMRIFAACKPEERPGLGRKLGGAMDIGGVELMDKGYAAVNKLLAGNPSDAERTVAYEFLLRLEWRGGYRDVYTPGQDFDYQRLFGKYTCADGALATMCKGQMWAVFRQDPAGFLVALTQWDQSGKYIKSIAASFGYEYCYNDQAGYLKTLTDLGNTLTTQDQKETLEVFLEQYRLNQG